MRAYISKCIIFIGILLTACVLLIAYKSYTLRSSSWSIEPQQHILFMGASHIQYAIDDSDNPEIRNLALASERYLYTYLKMRYVFRDNPQVDTVVLECAPTDLWEHTDNKYYQDFEARGHYPYCYQLFDWEEWRVFMPAYHLDLLANSLLDDLRISGTQFLSRRGGFQPVEDKVVTQAAADTLRPARIQNDIAAGHAVNYRYLRKIITLCQKRGVRLMLLYCPMLYPDYYYDQAQFHDAYKRNFADVPLLDYSNSKMDLDCFQDAHHLNARGARVFTRQLLNDIRRR